MNTGFEELEKYLPKPEVQIGDTLYTVKYVYGYEPDFYYVSDVVVTPVVIGNGVIASARWEKDSGWSYTVGSKAAFISREDAVARANEAIQEELKRIVECVKEKEEEIRQRLAVYGKIKYKEIV